MLRRAVVALCFVLASLCAAAQNSRQFTFHYEFTVRAVEQGKPLRIWIPLAHSSPYQTVRVISEKGDLPLKKTKEPRFGNTMLYAETKSASQAEYTFAVDYDVLRREHLALADGSPRVKETSLEMYLAPDKLVPTTGLPAEIAARTVAGKPGDLAKARAIYDYVLANMRYDKSGTGWGHGDSLWACDAKRGNCTDFHSLFISMARSQGIPSRFEIGFPLPKDKHAGEIPGYHCWAEFYVSGKGWVPVDISEAWKDKSRSDYFFGAHDANRVAFTMGRDLVLSPAQAGDPLNYFVYPYVEMDGKKYENVSNHFAFTDASAETKAAAQM
ncbi:MAG: transglutaminase-like domain-containing protein [Terriglobales bacterium]